MLDLRDEKLPYERQHVESNLTTGEPHIIHRMAAPTGLFAGWGPKL